MKPNPTGPVEGFAWPERLIARVATPGHAPRVHGYDVESDLARHYTFSDMMWLTLTGELPDASVSAAFAVAIQFAATTTVAEAPAHAGAVVRMAFGTTSAVIGSASVVLAEQARFVVERHERWLAWRDKGGPQPEGYLTTEAREHESVRRLLAALAQAGVELALPDGCARETAIVTALHALGLRSANQLQLAFVLARLPLVGAEALAVSPGSFKEYPMDLPPFRYEGPRP